MRNGFNIAVIIPALNEERSIALVLDAIPGWVDDVVVADNGSADRTAEVAQGHGARVVLESRRGYGSACLAAMAKLKSPDIVVFLDGDFSDHPEQMDRLVDPIIAGGADLVIGSRVLGIHEPGALTPQARFGNWLATRLIRLFWKTPYTDLGPFRAIRYKTLKSLRMADPDYGWTVEMQVKAAIQGARAAEVAVDYRRRIGTSKVSGTIRGAVGAGCKILGTIFIAALTMRRVLPTTTESKRLIVFTRYPQPGKAKTRLVPLLGEEGAAGLQREMTEFTMDTVKRLRRDFPFHVEIRFEGGDADKMADWLGSGFAYVPQGTGDLGERMARAMGEAFEGGVGKAVIIGADCPLLSADILREAFQVLSENDMAIGPASDGGYYLVGLNCSTADRALPHIFQGPAWGTDTVLDASLRLAEQCGLSVECLPELRDVDRPEDIAVWQDVRADLENRKQRPRVSVIIPALNEAEYIGETVRSVKSGCDCEIIVVDGGSADDTTAIAASLGAEVISAERGRARQANAGARLARGEMLLFLHADTRLPAAWDGLIEDALANPEVVAGAFRFATDMGGIWMRFFTWTANLRSQKLHIPYGDQGLFLRTSTFEQLGGFPEMPIMDDLEMVRRLARRGRIVVLPNVAVTSGRRWRRMGVWRTMCINQFCIAGYWLGVPLETLARWYNYPMTDN